MPLLQKGSMDKVKTGDEPLPSMKKVKVKVLAPTDQQKAREIHVDADGRFKILRLGLQLQEGEYKGRIANYSCFIEVTKDAYLSWNMKDGDRPLSIPEKEVQWENHSYLRDLKRLGKATDVDFEEQDIVDVYGKELTVDILERDDNYPSEAKNPRKIK